MPHSRVTGAISEGNIVQILAPFFNYSDMEKGYEDFQQDSAPSTQSIFQWLPYINNFEDQMGCMISASVVT
jgi:hypothetical protein